MEGDKKSREGFSKLCYQAEYLANAISFFDIANDSGFSYNQHILNVIDGVENGIKHIEKYTTGDIIQEARNLRAALDMTFRVGQTEFGKMFFDEYVKKNERELSIMVNSEAMKEFLEMLQQAVNKLKTEKPKVCEEIEKGKPMTELGKRKYRASFYIMKQSNPDEVYKEMQERIQKGEKIKLDNRESNLQINFIRYLARQQGKRADIDRTSDGAYIRVTDLEKNRSKTKKSTRGDPRENAEKLLKYFFILQQGEDYRQRYQNRRQNELLNIREVIEGGKWKDGLGYDLDSLWKIYCHLAAARTITFNEPENRLGHRVYRRGYLFGICK